MKSLLTRAVIYPQDVSRITGKSDRHGRLVLSRIKRLLSKEKHQMVSIDEFCAYTGLDPELVRQYITD